MLYPRRSLFPPRSAFSSWAKPAKQHSRTNKVIARNRTIMNKRLMDPCAKSVGAESHSREQLSTAQVKRLPEFEQDMGSGVHKGGRASVFGKDGCSRKNIKINKLSISKFRLPMRRVSFESTHESGLACLACHKILETSYRMFPN
jgi:hypothetical protein